MKLNKKELKHVLEALKIYEEATWRYTTDEEGREILDLLYKVEKELQNDN